MHVVKETALSILGDRVPDLRGNGFKTTSDARHKLWYNQKMGLWEDFVPKVRKFIDSLQDLDSRPVYYRLEIDEDETYLSYHDFLHEEQFFCGDEQSVCGRFVHNVLHFVTAVACAYKIKTRFGDFKVCHESKGGENRQDAAKKVPDFVAIDDGKERDPKTKFTAFPDGHHLRFVGEAKTPWCHDLVAAFRMYLKDPNSSRAQAAFRRALGQIAKYMHQYEMKYGFLTTYDYTIFLRQDVVKGEFRLHFSVPIPHNETSGKASVSLRECMFYLVHTTANSDYYFKNTMDIAKWVIDESPQESLHPSTPFKSPRTYAEDTALLRQPRPALPNMEDLSLAENSFHDPIPVQLEGTGHAYIVYQGSKLYVRLPAENPQGLPRAPTGPTQGVFRQSANPSQPFPTERSGYETSYSRPRTGYEGPHSTQASEGPVPRRSTRLQLRSDDDGKPKEGKTKSGSIFARSGDKPDKPDKAGDKATKKR